MDEVHVDRINDRNSEEQPVLNEDESLRLLEKTNILKDSIRSRKGSCFYSFDKSSAPTDLVFSTDFSSAAQC